MRHLFGGSLDAWTIDLGTAVTSPAGMEGFFAIVVPGIPVTFWGSGAGSENQYTDLQDLTGASISAIATDSAGQIPQFRGPDEVWWMWADANGGNGPRRLILATDMGDSMNELRASILDLIANADTNAALVASSLGVVRYDTASSSWPPRPTDSRFYMWIGSTAPTVGGTGMLDGVDVWLNPNPVA